MALAINPVDSNKTYTTLFGDHFNNLVVFGNPDVTTEFQNHLKMEFGGENYISFHDEGVEGTPTLDGDRLTLDTPEKTFYWEAGHNNNLMRWVEILKVKPASNKWILKLAGHQEFDFCYQTPLSEIALTISGSTIEYLKGWRGLPDVDSIKLIFPPGGPITFCHRPLNCEGSLAVYHKTKRDHILGHKNYRSGKAIHILRSKAVDADNKWVWVGLKEENGFIVETIPQSFLDTAKYPVKINATFGYTSVGGSTAGSGADYRTSFGGPYSPASDGDATAVSWYATGLSNTPYTCGIYNDNAGAPTTVLVQTGGSTEDTDGWITKSIASTGILAANAYWIGKNQDDDALTLSYDTVVGQDWKYRAATYAAGNLGDWVDVLSLDDYKVSAYITYTPSAGGIPILRRRRTG